MTLNKGGWGIKQLSPVFSPPFCCIFIPHYSYPPFPTPRFWCGFSLGMGIFRWEKREIFFFIQSVPASQRRLHYQLHFFLSPTTTIPHFLRRKNWRYFYFIRHFYSYPPLQLTHPPFKYARLRLILRTIIWLVTKHERLRLGSPYINLSFFACICPDIPSGESFALSTFYTSAQQRHSSSSPKGLHLYRTTPTQLVLIAL